MAQAATATPPERRFRVPPVAMLVVARGLADTDTGVRGTRLPGPMKSEAYGSWEPDAVSRGSGRLRATRGRRDPARVGFAARYAGAMVSDAAPTPNRPEPALRFRLAGIPIEIPAIALIVLIAGALSVGRTLGRALVWALVVLGSVLWHELGHAFAMRHGGHAPAIALHWWGGTTSWPEGARPSPRRSLLVSLAGPAAGLALGALAKGALLLGVEGPWAALVLGDLAYANLGWSLLNLAPLLPWDGGHALDALAEAAGGAPEPRWAGAVGTVVGAAGVAWAVATHELWVGYLAMIGLTTSWGRWQPGGRSSRKVRRAWAELGRGLTGKARGRLERALRRTRDPRERATLAEALAWCWLRESNPAAARQALELMDEWIPSDSVRAHLAAAEGRHAHVVELLAPTAEKGALQPQDVGPLVAALVALGRPEEIDRLHRAASQVGGRAAELLATCASEALFRVGRFEEALAVCARAAPGEPRHAYNAACCCARLGRIEEAAAWAARAADAGYRDPAAREDPDLAPLRGRPELARLAAG